MLHRCTYRLTDKHTVVARKKVEHLPNKGDVVNLNNERYVVNDVQMVGPSVTISVSVQTY